MRLIYLSHLRNLPFFDHPIMDASYHDTWAREIAGGGLVRAEPFFRAPLYPYLLAAIYSLSKGSYLVPRIIQVVLGGLTAVIALAFARRALGVVAGIAAGLVCALYPVLIYFEGELLTETLFIFLTMLGILLVDTARCRQAGRLWFLGGLTLGLALITRPSIGLFLPLAIVGALAFSKPKVAAIALLTVGMVIPVIPVAAHNYASSGEFIPVVWQGGINFYLGNNRASTGWSATSPEIRKDWWGGYKDMIAIPRDEMAREPTFGEVSSYWYRKGFEFIRTQPTMWLNLMLKKSAIFWSSLEFPNNQDFNFMKLNSWVLRNPLINFGTIAPLSLLGIIVLLRRWRDLFFLYAFLLAYFISTIAFFVCSRYRAPVVPALCIFAGGSVGYLVDLWRARRLAHLSVCLALLAGLAVLVNANLTGETLPDLAQAYTQTGKVYAERGDDEAAARYFTKALRANPNWGEGYEQLGILRMKQGDNEGAKDLMLKAVRIQPDLATAHRTLAMLQLSLGDRRGARRSIETAMRLAPRLDDSHNLLGSIFRQEAHTDSAIACFLEEVEINPRNWRAYANLGGVYDEVGDLESAAEAYSKAIELNPADPGIVSALAGVYFKQGRHDLARSLIDQAGSRLPQDTNLEYNRAVILQKEGRLQEAEKIYEEILKALPLHEGSLVNLGVIYANSGRANEARDLWLRALEVDPSNTTARRNLDLLDLPPSGSR